MAAQVKKLVDPDATAIGSFNEAKLAQTLDLTKKYAELSDSNATAKLKALTLADLYTDKYVKLATK